MCHIWATQVWLYKQTKVWLVHKKCVFKVKEGQVINSYIGKYMSLLPPCKSSLEMHIKCVNYQVYVWLHAHKKFPNLSRVEESGWNINPKDNIEYEWLKAALFNRICRIYCQEVNTTPALKMMMIPKRVTCAWCDVWRWDWLMIMFSILYKLVIF